MDKCNRRVVMKIEKYFKKVRWIKSFSIRIREKDVF